MRNRLGRVVAVTRVSNNAGQYGFRSTVNSLHPKKKGTKEIDLGGRIHGSYHYWRSTGMTTIRNEELCKDVLRIISQIIQKEKPKL